jgi:hypothetical protein
MASRVPAAAAASVARIAGEPSACAAALSEILDDAVVQVGGDPASLVGGRLDGTQEQCLALLLRPA